MVEKTEIIIEKGYSFKEGCYSYLCLININGEKIEKRFETKIQRDEYYKVLKAYVDGRTVRRDGEVNQKKRELEPLIKKLEEDIISIESNYCEDIKKEIGKLL